MRAALLGLSVIMLVPSLAHGWNWGSTTKKWSNPHNKPNARDFRKTSLNYRNNNSLWKQRYDSRRERQRRKPAGVNFSTPARQPEVLPREHRLQRMVLSTREKLQKALLLFVKMQRKGKLLYLLKLKHKIQFERFNTAWTSKWKNRGIKGNRQSPFTSTGGFGARVRRATPRVGMTWRLRRDLRRRIYRSPERPVVPMI